MKIDVLGKVVESYPEAGARKPMHHLMGRQNAKHSRWTREQKIGIWAVVVSVATIIVTVTVPELRRLVHLDGQTATTLSAQSSPTPSQMGTSELSLPPFEAPTSKVNESTKQNPTGTEKGVGNNRSKKVGSGRLVSKTKSNELTPRSPAESSPPIILQNSPSSAVSFGQQGGITAGTINEFGVTPPEPKITWTLADLPQPQNAKHPRTFGTLSVDHLFESAKFAVICDRACEAVGFGVAGFNRNCPGKIPGYPNVAAFVVLSPNPFPPETKATFGVASEDEIPVKILEVKKLKLTGDSGCH